MHFDWSISLGSVITIVAFAGSIWLAANRVYLGVDRRLGKFESLLTEHARTLVEHGVRMEKQDELLIRLVGDVQRLIGRMEGQNR